MTNDERIELLKAVAACAPKEMADEFCYVGPMIETPCTSNYRPNAVSFGEATLWLKDDLADAPAIIAMLDAMEKALDSGVVLTSGGTLLKGKYQVKFGGWDQHLPLCDTRAEAVARAFVAVFGGKG